MVTIEVRKLTKRFGPATVLNQLSVSVGKGQALCLFGPSGCGKTTLLRLIARLERPHEGEILLDGQCVNSPVTTHFPTPGQIGMVFQDCALWPHLRAKAHLEFVLQGMGLSRHERRHRTETMLTACRINALHRAYPAELSGGEQQRLAIARALVTTPPLLLLDEPLSNLDADLRKRMLDEFHKHKRRGTTIIFATHDPAEAESLGDVMLQMDTKHYTIESIPSEKSV